MPSLATIPDLIVNVATNKLLGRATAGTGPAEQIDLTAAGRALLDDADATAQRATLSLGDSATKNVGSGAGTVCAGDDARLSDARTPTGAAGGVLDGTYPNPSFAADMATQAELDAHVNDTSAAHAASAIAVTPFGSIAATDVQAALEEIVSEAGGGDAIPLSTITQAGGLVLGTGSGAVTELAPGLGGKAVCSDPHATNKVSVQYPLDCEHATRGATGSLAATFDRGTGVVTSVSELSTGRLSLYRIFLPKGMVCSGITFCSGSTGAGTPTNQWFGLFSNSLVPLALTNDDTNTAWANTTLKALAFAATFTTTYAGWYYVGIMVKATTVPNLAGITGLSTASPFRTASPTPGGHSSTSLTDPASCPNPAGAITITANMAYAEVF